MNKETAVREHAPGLHWRLALGNPNRPDYEASVAALEEYIRLCPDVPTKAAALETLNIGTIVDVFSKRGGHKLTTGRLVAISHASVTVTTSDETMHRFSREDAHVHFRRYPRPALHAAMLFTCGVSFALFAVMAWMDYLGKAAFIERCQVSWIDIPVAVPIVGMFLTVLCSIIIRKR